MNPELHALSSNSYKFVSPPFHHVLNTRIINTTLPFYCKKEFDFVTKWMEIFWKPWMFFKISNIIKILDSRLFGTCIIGNDYICDNLSLIQSKCLIHIKKTDLVKPSYNVHCISSCITSIRYLNCSSQKA